MLSPSLSGLWLHNPSYNSSVGKGYEEDIYIPKILVGQESTPSLPSLPSLSVSNLFLFLNRPSSKQRSLEGSKEKAEDIVNIPTLVLKHPTPATIYACSRPNVNLVGRAFLEINDVNTLL